MLWCGVQQGYRLREEALAELAGAGAEAPVTPAGCEEGKKTAVRIGGGAGLSDAFVLPRQHFL